MSYCHDFCKETDCERIIVDWDVSLFGILLELFHSGHLDILASKVAALLEVSRADKIVYQDYTFGVVFVL